MFETEGDPNREFVPVEIPANGQCLFHAIAALLATPTIPAPEDGVPNRMRSGEFDALNGQGVRMMVTGWMRNQWEYYGREDVIDFDPPEKPRPNETKQEKVNRYCDNMEKQGKFGGFVEVEAAAELFGINIVILELDNIGARVDLRVVESPCAMVEEDGDGKQKGDIKTIMINGEPEYVGLSKEELSNRDTAVLLLVNYWNRESKKYIPHYNAVVLNDTDRRKLFATSAQEGDMIKPSEMEKSINKDKLYVSLKEEKRYADRVERKIACGGKLNMAKLFDQRDAHLVAYLIKEALRRKRERSKRREEEQRFKIQRKDESSQGGSNVPTPEVA